MGSVHLNRVIISGPLKGKVFISGCVLLNPVVLSSLLAWDWWTCGSEVLHVCPLALVDRKPSMHAHCSLALLGRRLEAAQLGLSSGCSELKFHLSQRFNLQISMEDKMAFLLLWAGYCKCYKKKNSGP